MAGQVDTTLARFATRTPHFALRELVSSYHGYRYEVEGAGVHHGLPSTSLTVVLSFDRPLDVGWWGDEQSRGVHWALVSGLGVSPAAIHQEGVQHGITFDLTPLGARLLLGLPAAALSGELVRLGDVMASRADRLYAVVAEPTTWLTRFAALDRELLAVAAGTDPRSHASDKTLARAWARLHLSRGALPVARLADEVGWSRRHLTQRFTDEYGIGPKQAARVVRFQRARSLLVEGDRPLAEVAVDCGYADQAHLTREFRELAGDPPTTWLRAERPFLQDAGDQA
jgi:AraC-like DNA-binding protein